MVVHAWNPSTQEPKAGAAINSRISWATEQEPIFLKGGGVHTLFL